MNCSWLVHDLFHGLFMICSGFVLEVKKFCAIYEQVMKRHEQGKNKSRTIYEQVMKNP